MAQSFRYIIVGAGVSGASAIAGIREVDAEGVELGARGNDLPGVLTLLGDHYHRAHATWTRLKGLMIYPALVLMASPASPGRTIIEWQNRYLLETVDSLGPAQRDSLLRVSMRIVDSTAAQQPWLRFFLHHDPLPLARQVRIPVLVMHGGTDRQVPASEGEKLAAALRQGGNADVTFALFPGKNHLFLDDPSGDWRSYSTLPTRMLDSDVLGRLTAWLVSRLR